VEGGRLKVEGGRLKVEGRRGMWSMEYGEWRISTDYELFFTQNPEPKTKHQKLKTND